MTYTGFRNAGKLMLQSMLGDATRLKVPPSIADTGDEGIFHYIFELY